MLRQILAATLIVGAVVTASAQQDKPTSEQPSTRESKQQPNNQFNSSAYTHIETSDVPASLRKTLGGASYDGWERGKIYRNNNGEGYYLTTGSGSDAKSYYFDKNGKAVPRNSNSTQRTTPEGTSVSPVPTKSVETDSTSAPSQSKP